MPLLPVLILSSVRWHGRPVRLFGFPEIRDWLLAAGFAKVAGYGEDGRPLTASHRRMIVVAGLPSSPGLSELPG